MTVEDSYIWALAPLLPAPSLSLLPFWSRSCLSACPGSLRSRPGSTAMFLYTMTLITGQFEIVKESITGLSADRRIQALLIAFSFGAFIEGAAGFGTPVAIAGAMMVGLGFGPVSAAVLCLIANTAPVAFGALGTPIVTLAGVTGLPKEALSAMAGRQLPFFSILIPFWLTATMVKMNGGRWRDVFEVWPAIAVSGVSFALTQFLVSNYIGPELTDILGGVCSMSCLAGLMLFWKPKRLFVLPGDPPRAGGDRRVVAHSTSAVVKAWVPWAILTLFVFLWGLPPVKSRLNSVTASFPWPFLHGAVYRTPPVVPKIELERAIFNLNWLSAPGTGVLAAALVTGFLLGLSKKQWAHAMLDDVLSRLRAEFTASGGQQQFDALKVFVWGDQSAVSQVEVAARLAPL